MHQREKIVDGTAITEKKEINTEIGTCSDCIFFFTIYGQTVWEVDVSYTLHTSMHSCSEVLFHSLCRIDSLTLWYSLHLEVSEI